MKDGEVVERGTHEELLKMGGLYWSMWIEQSLGGGSAGEGYGVGSTGGVGDVDVVDVEGGVSEEVKT